MPKSQFIDPAFIRAKGKISFNDIDVNVYGKTITDERINFSNEDFLRIFDNMALIREFESMIYDIKNRGEYKGYSHSYPGPAHLSMGQEGAVVGQAYGLEVDDLIFGSHRSHGELLAKSLVSIHKLEDKKLMGIMEGFFDGDLLRVVEKENKSGKVKDLAVDFLLYGSLAEIFARKNGFQRGLGGSMHVFFLPFGVYPNNAIVGGAHPMALGASLFKKINDKKGIIIANSGDASIGCGPVFESLNMASMDQIKKLWNKDGGLPIIFNFFNNGYGMGGQTCGETMAYDMLARLGAGISPTQLHAERVDGMNPLAVIDVMKRKRDILLKGEGPVLLDVVTYRYGGHSSLDASSYRTHEEIELWQTHDPLLTFRQGLVDEKVAKDSEFNDILESIGERMFKIFKLSADRVKSPYIDFKKEPDFVEKLVFSNEHIPSMDIKRQPEVLMPKEENSRVKQIAKKNRFFVTAEGKAVPKNSQFNIRDGLFEPILDKFYEDPTTIAYGEDVRDWGGVYGVYNGLTESLPYHRFFNSPISESAIVGSAVGYAMCGGRAIVEIMYTDFLARAGDELFNQLAKWQAMSAGELKMPVVLRVSVGARYGSQHAQEWVALCSHIPGLKVVFPVTPYDCKGLMTKALNGTDPVIFFESQRIYDMGEMFHEGGVPSGSYEIDLGEPDVKKAGADVTILTIGATLYRALESAKQLQEKYGVDAEVIDARTIVPFNYEKVVESVKKTGKIVLASDACTRGSILNDMAQKITEMCFDYLDAPPVVVGAENWITPPFEFDDQFFPQDSWIIDAINDKIMPLKGHTSKKNNSDAETLRKAKFGV